MTTGLALGIGLPIAFAFGFGLAWAWTSNAAAMVLAAALRSNESTSEASVRVIQAAQRVQESAKDLAESGRIGDRMAQLEKTVEKSVRATNELGIAVEKCDTTVGKVFVALYNTGVLRTTASGPAKPQDNET